MKDTLNTLQDIKKRLNEYNTPILKTVSDIEKNIAELRERKSNLEEEVNGRIMPSIKVVKRRELEEITGKINLLLEDLNYLEDSLKQNDFKSELEEEYTKLHGSLMNKRNEINSKMSEIRDKHKQLAEQEINEMYDSEVDFRTAVEEYQKLGTELGWSYIETQI